MGEPLLHRSRAQPFPVYREPSPDEDLDDLNSHLRRVLLEQEQPSRSTMTTTVTDERARPQTTTASDLLLRRLAEQQTRTAPGTSLHQQRSTKPNTTVSNRGRASKADESFPGCVVSDVRETRA